MSGTMWMVGTEESVRHDAYTDGPHPSKTRMTDYMGEGDVLVGKCRDGSVASCERLLDGKLVPWPHPLLEAEAETPFMGMR